MTIKKTLLKNIKKLLFVTVTCIPLIACAGMEKPHDGDHDQGGGKPGEPGNNISDYEFSFTLDNKDGSVKPTVRQKHGEKKEIAGTEINKGESVKASSIEEVQTITVIRAKGSHYLMINIAGRNYRFDLPPPHP